MIIDKKLIQIDSYVRIEKFWIGNNPGGCLQKINRITTDMIVNKMGTDQIGIGQVVIIFDLIDLDEN